MGRHDLFITGATIVNAWGRQRADVVVERERSGVVEPGSARSARRVIDADGSWLLPGLVDTHCHHQDPGFTHKEDATTATRAAAAGGVTTTFAMPNVSPPPKDPATLAAMIDQSRRCRRRLEHQRSRHRSRPHREPGPDGDSGFQDLHGGRYRA